MASRKNKPNTSGKNTSLTKKPVINFNDLAADLNSKKFAPIREVCMQGEIYIILGAKIEKMKFSDILMITITPRNSKLEKKETYFTQTNLTRLEERLLSRFAVNIRTDPEKICGLEFSYIGEVETSAGHSYSKIIFQPKERNLVLEKKEEGEVSSDVETDSDLDY